MTLEQKKKALDAYVPAEYYTKGAYLDAQDTTNIFITGKIVGATATDVQVNYDGWPQKWDSVSRNTASIETETRLFFRKPNYSVFTAGIQEEIVQDCPV